MKQATCLLISTTLIAGPVHAAPAEATPPPADPATTPSSSTAPSSSTPTAAELSDQAVARFKAKDYDTAVGLFEQAYALDPNPNYLFNIGRVYEEKGDLKKAVEFYQRFVKEPGVQIESRDRAAQRLRVLKAIVEDDKNPDQQPEGPKPEEPKAEPLPTTTPQDAPDPNRNMRLAGYGLLGVGGVAMIVGGVFGGLAVGKQSDLKDSNQISDRQSLSKSGTTFALVSDVSLFSGIGLAATGLILVLVARKRTKAARAAFSPHFGRGHAGVTWSVRF